MAEAFDSTRAERVYLVEAEPYDPAGGATVLLRMGSKGVATGPGEVPANAYYEPVLIEPLSCKRSMYQPGAIGGRAVPDRGNLVIANDSSKDAWLAYRWDGRAVTVRLGLAGDAYADFQVVFQGLMGEAEYDRTQIRIPLRDKGSLLDKPLQENLYLGTGGNEGGDDLKDKPKPVTMGRVLNIAPVLVAADGTTYQVHDGPIDAVEAVYQDGVLLTLSTHYTVNLATGFITLTGAPTGLITCDVRGSKTGGVYVSSAADIAMRVLLDYSDLEAGDLDAASFTALNAKTTAVIGFYTGLDAVNVLDVLDQVINGIGGFHGADRAGLYGVGRFDAPTGSPVLTLDENDMVRPGPTRETPGPVRWRQWIEYARSWVVQTADRLGVGTTDAHKAFVLQQTRLAKAEDPDIKADGPGKGGEKGAIAPDSRPTLLVDEAAATAEAARVLALYGKRQDLFRVPCKHRAFQADLGDEVRISHPRLGLAGGRDLIVVGIDEKAAAGQVDLELWGVES